MANMILIDNYDSFTYNIKQSVESLGHTCHVYRNDAITCDQVAALAPTAVILSPGPGDPNSAGITLEVIARLSGAVPILGVCLGHQAIGQAFGGRVVRAPRPRHGKISKIDHDQKGLFSHIAAPLAVARYHSLMIERETLPSCLEISARTDDGVIMAVRHREFNTQGVQFHPESIATQSGIELFSNFLGGLQ